VKFWFCSGVFLLIIGFCIISYAVIQNGVQDLEKDIERVTEAVDAKDWQKADALMRDARVKWRRYEKFYALVARHQLYEPVAVGMIVLPKLIKEKSDEAYAAAVRLSAEMRLLRDAERFSWSNVL